MALYKGRIRLWFFEKNVLEKILDNERATSENNALRCKAS